jgi:hypothetical protein
MQICPANVPGSVKEDYMANEYLVQARIAAGYPNRELAEMAVPFAASTIGRHERGDMPLQPADIVAYAAGYRAPALLMLYCRNTCPIGRQQYELLQERELSLLTLRIGSRIKKTLRRMDRLEEIAEDDRVDSGERAEFDSIVAQIRGLREAVDEMELYALTLQNKIARQPADNRTAAPSPMDLVQQQYYTGSHACQRG